LSQFAGCLDKLRFRDRWDVERGIFAGVALLLGDHLEQWQRSLILWWC